MPFSTKMWLEKVCRKRLITSALRKDLLQIDGLYARTSKTLALYLEDILFLVQDRDKERCSNKQNLLYCNMLTISQAAKDRKRLS